MNFLKNQSLVTGGSYGAKQCDVVCTVSDLGELFVWDLSDYSHLQSTKLRAAVTSLCVSEAEDEILVGTKDSFIKAFRLSRCGTDTAPIWDRADAHRGAITAIAEREQYIVTGGEDFHCRVWHRRTREMLTQFCVHRKPVTSIILDLETPNLFHSSSEDKFIITYDIKKNTSIVQRTTPNSNVTGLSQRKDCERELLSCGLDGRILFWDIDVADPVGCFHEPTVKFTCLAVSPDGRYVAAGSTGGVVFIYDLSESRKTQEMEGGAGGDITSIRWAPDQKQLVTTSVDASVAVWNFFQF